MLRLLHITATHLNLAGGVPVVLRDLVDKQNDINGFEARVLSVNADVSQMKSQYFDFLGNKSFEKYIDTYKPDLVIFHSHYYFEYIKLFRYLLKKEIPYFIEPHGSFGKAALLKSKFKKRITNNFILHGYIKNTHGYIFLNASEAKDSVYRTNNDIVIPNGIKSDNTIWIINEKRNEMPDLYFIGRYDLNHKGLDYLVRALEILDRKKIAINVCFYGKGDKHETEWLEEKFENLKCVCAKNYGPVYGEEQANTLEQRGIMLLTSRYEGFPMTILEALKYGNPCIVTPGTNVAEEISSEKLGWKTDLNEELIAECIVEAINEYMSDRNSYIQRCKQYVNSMYDWSAIAQKAFLELSKVINRVED